MFGNYKSPIFGYLKAETKGEAIEKEIRELEMRTSFVLLKHDKGYRPSRLKFNAYKESFPNDTNPLSRPLLLSMSEVFRCMLITDTLPIVFVMHGYDIDFEMSYNKYQTSFLEGFQKKAGEKLLEGLKNLQWVNSGIRTGVELLGTGINFSTVYRTLRESLEPEAFFGFLQEIKSNVLAEMKAPLYTSETVQEQKRIDAIVEMVIEEITPQLRLAIQNALRNN